MARIGKIDVGDEGWIRSSHVDTHLSTTAANIYYNWATRNIEGTNGCVMMPVSMLYSIITEAFHTGWHSAQKSLEEFRRSGFRDDCGVVHCMDADAIVANATDGIEFSDMLYGHFKDSNDDDKVLSQARKLAETLAVMANEGIK